MNLKFDTKYIIFVLMILSLGFSLVYLSHLERNIPSVLKTREGLLDISYYFLTPFPNLIYGPAIMAFFLVVHLYLRTRFPSADPFIIPAVAILSGIGLIMILRLSPDLAYFRNEAIQYFLGRYPDAVIRENVHTLAKLGMKHFIFVATGIFVMFISIIIFNQRVFSWLSSKKYLWVLASVLLIFVTLLFGTKINERRLWLFGFQTVELVKLLIVFFISGYFYEKARGLMMYRNNNFKAWVNYGGPFVFMCFFAVIPIFIQRDLGPTFLIFLVFLLMFYYAGNRNLITALFVVLIITGAYVSYETGFPSIVRQRFQMMLDPFGKSESIARSLWSISSGGILGSGIGFGEPYRIPEVQSDYTFSAICEEMGFIGGVAVIFAYVILLYRCFRISSKTDNSYKKILVICIATFMGMQAFIIICGNLGVIPMTGITLPLVSYGGSSMIINFLMIGIVISVSGERSCPL